MCKDRTTFWAKHDQRGGLCSLREVIHHVQVDKKGSTFSISDEFVCHCFKAHLMACVCKFFNKSSPTLLKDGVMLLESQLEQTAKSIVEKYMLIDEKPNFQHSFLYTAFLYPDLRRAIRFEEGEQIIRHWHLWLSYFLVSGKYNYAREAATLLCNVQARYPRHIAYIVTIALSTWMDTLVTGNLSTKCLNITTCKFLSTCMHTHVQSHYVIQSIQGSEASTKV